MIVPIALLTVSVVDCPTSSEALPGETPRGGLTVTLAVLVPRLSVTDSVATPTAFAVTLIFPLTRLVEAAVGLELASVTVPRMSLTTIVALSPGSKERVFGERLRACAPTAIKGRIRLESQRRLWESFIFSFSCGVFWITAGSPSRSAV